MAGRETEEKGHFHRATESPNQGDPHPGASYLDGTLVFRALPDALLLTDVSGVIHQANPAAQTLLGSSYRDLAGKSVSHFVVPEDLETLHRLFGRVDPDTTMAIRLQTSRGCVATDIRVVRTPDPRFKQDILLWSIRDITAREIPDAEHPARKHAVSAALDSLSASVAILDHTGCIQYTNQAWRTFARNHGYVGDPEMVGMDYLAVCAIAARGADFESQTAAQAEQGIRDVLAGHREDFTLEYPCIRPGEERWFILRVTPLVGTEPRHVVVSHEDITDHKRTEEELFESRQMLRTILDTIPQRVFWKDRNSVYLGGNKPLARDCGYENPSDLIGKTDYETASADTADRYRADDREVMETDRPRLGYEELQIKPDGSRAWLMTSKVPLHDMDGHVIGVLGTYDDITDRKHAEEALRANETLLRQFLESAPAAVAMFDRDLRYLATSKRWLTDCHLGDRDIIGQKHSDIFPDLYSVKPEWKTAHERGLAGAVERCEEDHIRWPDGSDDWIRWEVRPWHDASGSVGGIIIFSEVITERKRAEDALRESERELREAHQIAQLGRWELDIATDRLTWSPTIYEMFEVDPRTFGASFEAFMSFVHPDDRETVHQTYRQSLADRTPYELTHRLKMPDGRIKYMREKCRTEYDAEGRPVRSVGIVQDVTNIKQAEEALRLDESRLEALLQLNQMTEASLQEITNFALEQAVRLTKSKIGYLSFVNEDETMLRMHSWSHAAMAECTVAHQPRDYVVADTGLWGEAVRQRRPIITNDYQAANSLKKGTPEGHVQITRHMNAPIFEGDHIVVVAGVGNKDEPYDEADVRQLTLLMQGMWRLIQRKRAEDALREARDELEMRVRERTADLIRSNTELARFAYVASHDLQEPLRMVASYVQLLEMRYADRLDDRAKEFIGYAVEGAQRMQALIKGLLEYSQIETQGGTFMPIDTEMLLQHVLESLKPVIEETGAQITHDPLPTVKADRRQLARVFQNLIDNALKFRRPDVPPVIHVSAQSNVLEWIFSVRDNGIGVDPQYFDRLFIIFQRLHAKRHFPGTGIGLALVKRIVERHKGRVWLESKPNEGATFYFSLPASQS